MQTISVREDISPQHQSAVKLAGWGFKVGPLNGKIPLTEHGHKDFTTNMDQVAAWWTRWPNANIGARVFKGHVVVDIDPRNDGETTWGELNRGQKLPETLTTRTGSGGLHLWFKLPSNKEVRGAAGPGVDLKTHRGYLVMPGSYHPETGGLYVCETWAEPAVLPAWLHSPVFRPTAPRPQPRSSGPGGHGLVGAVEQATEGNRNNTLFWAACRMLDEGLDLLEEIVGAARNIGLTDGEIARTLDSAEREVSGVAS